MTEEENHRSSTRAAVRWAGLHVLNIWSPTDNLMHQGLSRLSCSWCHPLAWVSVGLITLRHPTWCYSGPGLLLKPGQRGRSSGWKHLWRSEEWAVASRQTGPAGFDSLACCATCLLRSYLVWVLAPLPGWDRTENRCLNYSSWIVCL